MKSSDYIPTLENLEKKVSSITEEEIILNIILKYTLPRGHRIYITYKILALLHRAQHCFSCPNNDITLKLK